MVSQARIFWAVLMSVVVSAGALASDEVVEQLVWKSKVAPQLGIESATYGMTPCSGPACDVSWARLVEFTLDVNRVVAQLTAPLTAPATTPQKTIESRLAELKQKKPLIDGLVAQLKPLSEKWLSAGSSERPGVQSQVDQVIASNPTAAQALKENRILTRLTQGMRNAYCNARVLRDACSSPRRSQRITSELERFFGEQTVDCPQSESCEVYSELLGRSIRRLLAPSSSGSTTYLYIGDGLDDSLPFRFDQEGAESTIQDVYLERACHAIQIRNYCAQANASQRENWTIQAEALLSLAKKTELTPEMCERFHLWNSRYRVSESFIPEEHPVIDRVFPNPASDRATLRISRKQADKSPVVVTLNDTQGHELRRIQVQAEVGVSEFPLDLQGLDPGTLLVRVQDGARIETIKLVVQ